MEIENRTGIVTSEVAEAIIFGRHLPGVIDSLIRAKSLELKKFTERLREEQRLSELLIESLKMPEGTAARRIANAVVEELRQLFPDAVERGEAERREHEAMEAAMLESVLRR